MVTIKQRKKLKEYGYVDEQIDRMSIKDARWYIAIGQRRRRIKTNYKT